MTENYELIDNEEKHQYEFHVEGYVPRIEYIKSLNGEIYLTVAGYIHKHPEWKRIVLRGAHIQ